MNLELIVFISPILGVLFFFFIERYQLNKDYSESGRSKAILSIEAINLITSFLLSMWFLLPLVFFLQDMQLLSLSNWKVPHYLSFAISILILDFATYLNHLLHHKVPILWRLHRLHHIDRRVDSLTTFLHHPFELLTTFLNIVIFAVIFDIPLIALLTYGLISSVHSAFTHFNWLIPDKWNKYIKFLIVTPNFHRVHHSINMTEGNSNFSTVFPVWDYLFRTVIIKKNIELETIFFGIDNQLNNDTISFKNCIINPCLNLIK